VLFVDEIIGGLRRSQQQRGSLIAKGLCDAAAQAAGVGPRPSKRDRHARAAISLEHRCVERERPIAKWRFVVDVSSPSGDRKGTTPFQLSQYDTLGHHRAAGSRIVKPFKERENSGVIAPAFYSQSPLSDRRQKRRWPQSLGDVHIEVQTQQPSPGQHHCVERSV
jgi:hypothetical protein